MASLKGLTREAVDATLDEFDAIGRRAFLERYRFGEAKGLYLAREGKRYDSKAIVGAAMARVPGRRALEYSDFTGGVASVVRALEKLGYEIVDERPPRNPPWAAEEIILALDVYLTHGLLDDLDAPVIRLSDDLNALDIHPERPDAERWRNPNGAAMKLGNFAHFDPAYPGQGLDAGSRLDRRVWDRLSPYPDLVGRLANQIRAGSRVDLDTLPLAAETDAQVGSPGPAPSTRVTAITAPVEGHHSLGKYEVSPSGEPRFAERLEQPLVESFCQFLVEGGYEHGRVLYSLDGVIYATDLVVRANSVLFEAKYRTGRGSIRMAVGQVKDYDYMQQQAEGNGFAVLALLLGGRPTESALGYLRREGIGAAWPIEDSWAATADLSSLLTGCDWRFGVPGDES